MKDYKLNRINKSDFLKLNEDDLIFITNPGRMGDEDGSTFIIMNGNELSVYRVDGWMYQNMNVNPNDYISYEDALKQFPKWKEAIEHSQDKDYKGKYEFFYMGFGNGLCVDNSIYEEYKPYLNDLVKKYLDEINKEEKDSYEYSAIFNVWMNAVVNMANDKGYILKK